MTALAIKYLPHLIGAIAVISLLWLVNHWRVEAGKVEGLETQVTTLQAQINSNIEECAKTKQTTKESDEYYKNIIAKRDADIIKLQKRPARCVNISRPTEHPASATDQHGGGNGLPSEILYRYAGFCEAYRGATETLQRHNDKVRCKLKDSQ